MWMITIAETIMENRITSEPLTKGSRNINDLRFVCPDGRFLKMEMGKFQYITKSRTCMDKISHSSSFLQT